VIVIEPHDISRALHHGEFLPHFQPIVHLRTGQLYGFELLARWNHPRRGPVAPQEFIPQAERDGWIGELTHELMRQAFPVLARLSPSCKLAVNISPLRLRAQDLPRQICDLGAASGFALQRLILEVTESALMDDVEQSRSVAAQLKEMGCHLALDDFGTGYSSLSHLQALPFDELKVDRSFVQRMTQQRDSRKIVAAVVGLGQSLGLTTVAEGVETQEQVEMLLWLGCELGQGWHYGRPAPAAELPAIVAALEQSATFDAAKNLAGRPSFSLDGLPAQRLSHLQAVYDSAPVGLAFLDRELRYRDINRRLANLNGHPVADHIGRTVAEMLPEIFPVLEPYLRRALSGESVSGIEMPWDLPEPNPVKDIVFSYEPARDEADEIVGVSVAVIDVTRLKRAEEDRRTSEEHFRNMMELLPQIPWVLDPDGRALDVSRRWLALSGMSGEDWRGFGWLTALHPDDVQPTLDIMHHSIQTGEPMDAHYRVRPKGSDWIWVHARGSARRDEKGNIQLWYGSLEAVPRPVHIQP